MNPNVELDIAFLLPGDVRFIAVERLAKSILNQDRYLTREYPVAMESHVLGAFQHDRAIGFLRFLVQVIGAEQGRTPVLYEGNSLTEAYVEAFGVDPSVRRQGVGTALQECAIAYARQVGCYQIRSPSPVTSQENYALKLTAGYVVHPSNQTDSYYFILKL